MKRKISISIQISIFLIIAVFVPVASMMALKTYENQQLELMESSLVQQGRLVASALDCSEGELNVQQARNIIERMNGRFDSRIRVLDDQGKLIVDSSRSSEVSVQDNPDYKGREKSAKVQSVVNRRNSNQTFIYRMLSKPVRIYRKFFRPPSALVYDSAEFYAQKSVYDGVEVKAALEGRYGSATRISDGQVSVTLYSAIPVFDSQSQVQGVILVSRSTYRILKNLYDLRLDLGKIFLWSLLTVVLIALLLNFRISEPLKKLSRQTVQCADKNGTVLFSDFAGKKRHDEIGDLSRSFTALIQKLNKRIQYADAFSADISHEFKNPLAAIRSLSEMLESEKLSSDRRMEFSTAIGDEVQKLEVLINGVRKISKIETGSSASLEAEYIPVESCLKNVIQCISKKYSGLEIEYVQDEFNKDNGMKDKALILMPEENFVTVIENLCDNASAFAGKIRFSSQIQHDRKNGYSYKLTAQDDGPGIAPEERDKVFERFYSNRGQTTGANESHSGLGLSIVRAIVEAGDGKIYIEENESDSTDLYKGARFTVIIPAVIKK